MNRFITLILMAVFAIPTFAQPNSQWVEAAFNDQVQILFRKGSVERITNTGGEKATSVIGQWINKRTKEINLIRFYVTDDDCARGYGVTTLLDMQGKHLTSSDMILGGNSIASNLADVICSVRQPTTPSTPSGGFNPNRI